MTENTRKAKKTANVSMPKKHLIHTVLLCTFLMLTGCNGGFPTLPSFPGFNEETPKKPKSAKTLKEEITTLRDKSPKRPNLNPKNLFGKNIRSTDDRIDRLERVVQDMRNEFDSAKPSIERLTALETEIQTLVRELQTLNQADFMVTEPAMAKPQPIVTPQFNTTYKAPQYKAPKSFQKKSAPPVQGGKASVYDVRIGEHPGRTRIVIDVNSKTSFNVDVDNNENIMVVDLPQASWNAAKVKSFARSPFISSYKVETSGQGHILILQLKRNARVSYQKDLKGFSGNSRRLVIDLSAS